MAKQWRQHASQHVDLHADLVEGLHAYALEHVKHEEAQSLAWAPVHEQARATLQAITSGTNAYFPIILEVVLDLELDESSHSGYPSDNNNNNW